MIRRNAHGDTATISREALERQWSQQPRPRIVVPRPHTVRRRPLFPGLSGPTATLILLVGVIGGALISAVLLSQAAGG